MIDLAKVYDLITQAFHMSDNEFHWGDNAVIQGSLENLPAPSKIAEFNDGDYFALVDASTVTPEKIGNSALFNAHYHYSMYLCHKGKVGNITKLRTDIANKFSEGWFTFWQEQGNWKEDNDNIFLKVDELESEFDIIAVQFVGTISQITTKGKGSMYG
jgi:hypothetical protein